MLQTWHSIKGYVAGAVALIACPCHLPITLPLLIVFTAGTAFGTWLENNTLTVFVILTVIFIGGIVLAFKWVREGGRLQTRPDVVRPGLTKQGKARVREARAALLARQSGSPQVTLLTSANCKSCQSTQTIWRQVHELVDFQFEAVDITSPRGRNLAARHNIFRTPTTIVDDDVVIPGTLDLEDALAVVHPFPH